MVEASVEHHEFARMTRKANAGLAVTVVDIEAQLAAVVAARRAKQIWVLATFRDARCSVLMQHTRPQQCEACATATDRRTRPAQRNEPGARR